MGSRINKLKLLELDKLWTLAYELHLFSPNQGCCLPVKTSGKHAMNFHQSTWLLENAWLLSYKHPNKQIKIPFISC